jgi:transglutaminase/protease-like cytokinesis protein 3
MRKILKIIIIGLIAGATYKYLTDSNIRPGEKLRETMEWIVSKAEELESSSKNEEESKTSDESNQNPTYDSRSSTGSGYESMSPRQSDASAYDVNPSGEPAPSSSMPEESEAVEYPVTEKKFPGTSRFPGLDKYARETPEEAEKSMEVLIGWLMKPASDDLEKARLIFTWIAAHVSYDDNGFNTGNYASTSPESVFRDRGWGGFKNGER